MNSPAHSQSAHPFPLHVLVHVFDKEDKLASFVLGPTFGRIYIISPSLQTRSYWMNSLMNKNKTHLTQISKGEHPRAFMGKKLQGS